MRALLIAAALLAATPVAALDMTAPITQLDGSDFADPSGKSAPLTLAKVAENALLYPFPDEQTLSGEEKIRRYVLAEKIYKSPADVALTADETELLKKLIAKAYSAAVVGRAWEVLDPASVHK